MNLLHKKRMIFYESWAKPILQPEIVVNFDCKVRCGVCLILDYCLAAEKIKTNMASPNKKPLSLRLVGVGGFRPTSLFIN